MRIIIARRRKIAYRPTLYCGKIEQVSHTVQIECLPPSTGIFSSCSSRTEVENNIIVASNGSV